MAIYTDNPAGRLYNALQRIKRYPNTGAGLQEWIPAVLGVEDGDLQDVARGLAELFQLPGEIRNQVNGLTSGPSAELMLRWLPDVETLMKIIMYHPITPAPNAGQVAERISEKAMMSLEICSETLHFERRELTLSDAGLARLQAKIREVLTALRVDPDLDSDLRDILVNHTLKMQQACQSFIRTGVSGLREAYNETVGDLVNNGPLIAGERDKGTPAWKIFTAVLATVGTLVGSSAEVITAIETSGSSKPVIEQVFKGPVQIAPGSPAGPQQDQEEGK